MTELDEKKFKKDKYERIWSLESIVRHWTGDTEIFYYILKKMIEWGMLPELVPEDENDMAKYIRRIKDIKFDDVFGYGRTSLRDFALEAYTNSGRSTSVNSSALSFIQTYILDESPVSERDRMQLALGAMKTNNAFDVEGYLKLANIDIVKSSDKPAVRAACVTDVNTTIKGFDMVCDPNGEGYTLCRLGEEEGHPLVVQACKDRAVYEKMAKAMSNNDIDVAIAEFAMLDDPTRIINMKLDGMYLMSRMLEKIREYKFSITMEKMKEAFNLILSYGASQGHIIQAIKYYVGVPNREFYWQALKDLTEKLEGTNFNDFLEADSFTIDFMDQVNHFFDRHFYPKNPQKSKNILNQLMLILKEGCGLDINKSNKKGKSFFSAWIDMKKHEISGGLNYWGQAPQNISLPMQVFIENGGLLKGPSKKSLVRLLQKKRRFKREENTVMIFTKEDINQYILKIDDDDDDDEFDYESIINNNPNNDNNNDEVDYESISVIKGIIWDLKTEEKIGDITYTFRDDGKGIKTEVRMQPPEGADYDYFGSDLF